MKLKPGTIALIVILAVTLFFVGYLFTYHRTKIILVPAIACGVILVLGAVQLSKELLASAKTAGADIDRSKTVDAKAKQATIRYLKGFGWVAGFAVTVYLIGFIYGTFFFQFLLYRFNGKRSWLKSVTVAILGTAAFWLLFVYWLQTDLWGGAIFSWFNLHLPTLTTK